MNGDTLQGIDGRSNGAAKKRKAGDGGARGRAKRGRAAWPDSSRQYCRFVLYKENLETQAALGLLSRWLHCPSSAFSIAGTKDKRGVTVQEVTVFKVCSCRIFLGSPRAIFSSTCFSCL